VLGFRFRGSGFLCWVSCVGFRISGFGCRGSGSGVRLGDLFFEEGVELVDRERVALVRVVPGLLFEGKRSGFGVWG